VHISLQSLQLHSSLQWQQQQQLGWQNPSDQVQQLVQQLLPYDDTLAFASALRALQQQQPNFNQAALERTIEAVRTDVSGIPLHQYCSHQYASWPPGGCRGEINSGRVSPGDTPSSSHTGTSKQHYQQYQPAARATVIRWHFQT
jgi:hypothetical protein